MEAGGSESEREVGGGPLKMEEGAISQGVPAASRSWKKEGNGFFPGHSREGPILRIPFIPVRPTSDL